MAEYIEHEKVRDLLWNFHKPYGVGDVMWINITQDIVDELDEIPAADVVTVVRCRDCRFYYDKHYEDEGEAPYIKRCCKYSNHTRQPDDFCSLGERKSGEQE